MARASLRGMPIEDVDRIIVVITKDQCDDFDADLILGGDFCDLRGFELCVLPQATCGPLDSALQAIRSSKVVGAVTVKDCDARCTFSLPLEAPNFLVGINAHEQFVANLAAKSFLEIDDTYLVQRIVEKDPRSRWVVGGVYGFGDAEKLAHTGDSVIATENEPFMSHVVSKMISQSSERFICVPASDYDDWGTLREWLELQRRSSTVFLDFDGVVVVNSGRYGRENWDGLLRTSRFCGD